jgi:tRNA/rRNA methyltransferase
MRVAGGGADVWAAPQFAPATHEDIEALHAHLRRTLVALRFLNPAMPRRLLPRLRRLFARTGLEREEINILRGILARVDELVVRARPR